MRVLLVLAVASLAALMVSTASAGRPAVPHFLRLLKARTARRAAMASRARARHAASTTNARARSPALIDERWFTQRLDHFGRSHGKTWQQRYWVNTDQWKGSGPLFVQLGEEGEASPGYTQFQMYNYALAYPSVLLAAVEHRYYGKSQPTGDYANLDYLSVDQGLADFVNVIQLLQRQYNISQVVVFGCSYIGSGAAWLRAKYPHVALGAVASSPPVLATPDFYQYLDQVGTSIVEQFGAQCDSAIRAAMADIVTRINNQDRSLVKIFNLCEMPSKPLDVSTFIMNIAGSVMTTVQYVAVSALFCALVS